MAVGPTCQPSSLLSLPLSPLSLSLLALHTRLWAGAGLANSLTPLPCLPPPAARLSHAPPASALPCVASALSARRCRLHPCTSLLRSPPLCLGLRQLKERSGSPPAQMAAPPRSRTPHPWPSTPAGGST